ncbi:hypothetical protein [Clostridium estertheticum]|uniref:hypothetical protein n=1 Tax=Clostridium estertheticum TaxID=238834 RepID=UPI0021F4906B|nr:hypothetical protein [Clostridium estertheticum]
MDNHVHILIRTEEKPLGQFIGRIHSKYAKYYNKKYKKGLFVAIGYYLTLKTRTVNYIKVMWSLELSTPGVKKKKKKRWQYAKLRFTKGCNFFAFFEYPRGVTFTIQTTRV